MQVISGMARGIDGISQEAALYAGGVSFAVLGSGVDVCYPAQNRALYDQIQKQGGILSIYPPGTEPRPQNFPPRNRIVSGLADVVVVIEARQKSGTLITVDMALEQGKEVYVVPGRITDRLSDGCNKLMKQGAGVVLSPEEFLEEIRGLWKNQSQPEDKGQFQRRQSNEQIFSTIKMKTVIEIPEALQEVYDLLDFYPKSVEQLLEQLPKRYDVTSLNTALMRLCLDKQVLQVSPGHFCRNCRDE